MTGQRSDCRPDRRRFYAPVAGSVRDGRPAVQGRFGLDVTAGLGKTRQEDPPPLLADLDCAVHGSGPLLRVCLGSSVMVIQPHDGSARQGPAYLPQGPSALAMQAVRRIGGPGLNVAVACALVGSRVALAALMLCVSAQQRPRPACFC
jgi:hypothetical protein